MRIGGLGRWDGWDSAVYDAAARQLQKDSLFRRLLPARDGMSIWPNAVQETSRPLCAREFVAHATVGPEAGRESQAHEIF